MGTGLVHYKIHDWQLYLLNNFMDFLSDKCKFQTNFLPEVFISTEYPQEIQEIEVRYNKGKEDLETNNNYPWSHSNQQEIAEWNQELEEFKRPFLEELINIHTTDILGKYLSKKGIIILYYHVIRFYSELFARSIDKYLETYIILQSIVLFHEIGHWISHKLPYFNAFDWNTGFFNKSDISVKESYAQIVPWWIGESYNNCILVKCVKDSKLPIKNIDYFKQIYNHIFEQLLQTQSTDYKQFRQYVTEDRLNCTARFYYLLPYLRNCHFPIKLELFETYWNSNWQDGNLEKIIFNDLLWNEQDYLALKELEYSLDTSINIKTMNGDKEYNELIEYLRSRKEQPILLIVYNFDEQNQDYELMLFLEKMNLSIVPIAIKNFINLKEVSLRNNNIGIIEPTVFGWVDKIYLGGNPIPADSLIRSNEKFKC